MKKILAILGVVLVVVAVVVLCLVFRDKKEPVVVLTDAEKFSQEYTLVEKENIFVYKTIDEIIKIMEKGTGVVLLGFPECKWCQQYAVYLNQFAKEEGLEKIYYYNIKDDRTNNTENYQKIVSILEKKLENDQEGNPRIFVPNVSFHIDGKLIGNDLETANDTKGFKEPSEYWDEESLSKLETKLKKYIKEVVTKINSCTCCND